MVKHFRSPSNTDVDPGYPSPLDMERLLLFTDAVFAIIMTLLALDIRIPDGRDFHSIPALRDALGTMSSGFAAYAASFLIVASMWNTHLKRYQFLRGVNSKVVALNMIQLLLLGLVPFATSMLSKSTNALALSLYAAILAFNVAVAWIAWFIATRDPALLRPELTLAVRREQNIRSAVVITAFAISIPVAWWSRTSAVLIWALQVPLSTIASRLNRRL